MKLEDPKNEIKENIKIIQKQNLIKKFQEQNLQEWIKNQNQYYSNSHLFKDTFWSSYIFIELDFMLKKIKPFAIELIKDKILNQNNTYVDGIDSCDFDFLDACAEYVTYKIKQEIEFYNKWNPYETLKTGLFGNGFGISGEYIIPIKIEIDNKFGYFQDEFNWDILDKNNDPEEFAKSLVIENNLDPIFTNFISMEIRRQIKNCVINLFTNLSCQIGENSQNVSQSTKFKKKNKKEKSSKISLANKSSLNIEILNKSVLNHLGLKRKRNESSNKQFILPDFLKNSEENLNIYKSYFDFDKKKASEYLVKCNHKHIIVNKQIFQTEENEDHKKITHSPEHGDATKTEDEEKNEEKNENQNLELMIPLNQNDI